MPNYKGHLVGGVVAFTLTLLVVGYHQPVTTIIPWFVACMIGALFPDVDTNSKGQKLFFKMVFVGLVVLLWYRKIALFIMLSLIVLFPFMVRHRGMFHRLWFILLLAVVGGGAIMIMFPVVDQQAIIYNLIFFVAGAVSHLFLDFGFCRMFRV